MRGSNIQSGAAQLQDSLEKLMEAWQQTREVWNDQRALHFEETVLKTLSEEVGQALPAIGLTTQVIQQAYRACEE